MSHCVKVLGVIIGEAESVDTTEAATYHKVTLNYIGKNFLGKNSLDDVSIFSGLEPHVLPCLVILADIGEIKVLIPEEPDEDEDLPDPMGIQWKPNWQNLMSHLP